MYSLTMIINYTRTFRRNRIVPVHIHCVCSNALNDSFAGEVSQLPFACMILQWRAVRCFHVSTAGHV